MTRFLRPQGRNLGNLGTAEKTMTRRMLNFPEKEEQLFDRWCSSKKIGSDYPYAFVSGSL